MKSMLFVVVAIVLVVTSSLAQEQPAAELGVQSSWHRQPPRRPWRPYEAQATGDDSPSNPAYRSFADDAMVEKSVGETVGQQSALPEESNYATIGLRGHWCVCYFVCVCYGSRKRRSASPIPLPDEETVPSALLLFGSATEMKLYASQEDRSELYKTPVVRAELYERPLHKAALAEVAAALGYRQSSVVITLNDGRRFQAVKGNNMGEGRRTVLILADHMTDDWVKVGVKDVQSSVVGDYVRAGGQSFDPLRDHGKAAALRMMALP